MEIQQAQKHLAWACTGRSNDMTDLLRRYLELEARLSRWRAEHLEFSPEEASMLDEIDAIWCRLSRDEVVWLDAFIGPPPPMATP